MNHVCVSHVTRLKNDLSLRVIKGHEWPDCQQTAVSNSTQSNSKPAARREKEESKHAEGI